MDALAMVVGWTVLIFAAVIVCAVGALYGFSWVCLTAARLKSRQHMTWVVHAVLLYVYKKEFYQWWDETKNVRRPALDERFREIELTLDEAEAKLQATEEK